VKASKGLTLLEAVIGLALFMILSVGVFFVWQHTTRASAGLLARQYAFENARATMDALIMNMQMSRRIVLVTDSNNILQRIHLIQRDPIGDPHVYRFTFDVNLPPGDLRYQRVEFNDNEFASGIAEIRIVYIQGNRMDITIVTGCPVPIIIEGSADVRYKIIEVNP